MFIACGRPILSLAMVVNGRPQKMLDGVWVTSEVSTSRKPVGFRFRKYRLQAS